MARRFAKVSEEEIVAVNEAAFFYPSDLVNTKTTIFLTVKSEKREIYCSAKIRNRSVRISHKIVNYID